MFSKIIMDKQTNGKTNSRTYKAIDIIIYLFLSDGEVSESFTLADASQHKINQAIPDHVVFYEPDTKVKQID